MALYYDYPVAKAAGKGGGAVQFLPSSLTNANAAGKGSEVDQFLPCSSAVGKGAGKATPSGGLWWYTAPAGKAAASGSQLDQAVLANRVTSPKGAGKGGEVDQFLPSSLAGSKGAGKPAVSWADLTDHPGGKGAGKASVLDQFLPNGVLLCKAGGKSGGLVQSLPQSISAAKGAASGQVQGVPLWRSLCPVKAAGKGAQVERKSIETAVTASAGAGKSSVVDQFLLYDAPSLKLAGGGGAQVAPMFRPQDLITACRSKVQSTLPEVKSVPEALTSGMLMDSRMPMVVILAEDPTPTTEFAVNDLAAWCPIEFLYICKLAGDGTDTAQVARRRLDLLMSELLIDHEMAGITTRIELGRIPMDRMNAYQQFFAEQAMQTVVMTLRVEFLLVTSEVRM